MLVIEFRVTSKLAALAPLLIPLLPHTPQPDDGTTICPSKNADDDWCCSYTALLGMIKKGILYILFENMLKNKIIIEFLKYLISFLDRVAILRYHGKKVILLVLVINDEILICQYSY